MLKKYKDTIAKITEAEPNAIPQTLARRMRQAHKELTDSEARKLLREVRDANKPAKVVKKKVTKKAVTKKAVTKKVTKKSPAAKKAARAKPTAKPAAKKAPAKPAAKEAPVKKAAGKRIPIPMADGADGAQ